MKQGNKATKVSRFTLIEVVIIIVIVALLSVLVLPFIVKKREAANKKVCEKNLWFIGQTMIIYADNFSSNHSFPSKKGRKGLGKLVEKKSIGGDPIVAKLSIFVCPSTDDAVLTPPDVSTNSSYAYSTGLTWDVSKKNPLGFVSDRANNHNKYGNILFTDGHVKGYAGANWSSNGNGSVFDDFK